jgi:hypothetical protein
MPITKAEALRILASIREQEIAHIKEHFGAFMINIRCRYDRGEDEVDLYFNDYDDDNELYEQLCRTLDIEPKVFTA